MKIVTTKGQGPVLNVLHGWGMNAHLFDDWSETLAQNFCVNLIDVVGPVDAIYNRATLVALPLDMRSDYKKTLMTFCNTANQLLITFEYDQS